MKHTMRFLALFILGIGASTQAQIVNKELAEKVAKGFLYEHSDLKDFPNLTLSYTEYQQNQPIYYIFNEENGKGFVIVTAEQSVRPVLGFSKTAPFPVEEENVSPEVKYWMNGYKDQIIAVRKEKLAPTEESIAQWKHYSQIEIGAKTTQLLTDVGPLTTTTWSQGCNYNAQTPVDAAGACGHTYTGCVATAMAQVLKYWNYPPQGINDICYTSSTYGQQCVNYATTTYNWASMPNTLTSANTEVAKLMYHVGASVEMQYGTSGSNAIPSDCEAAYMYYFNYDPSVQYLSKSVYSDNTWEGMLRGQLDMARVVQYIGYAPNAGHSWIIDGYSGTNYFHCNWGWGGYANGYFYLNNLSAGGYNFSTNQKMIRNIFPAVNTSCSPTITVSSAINSTIKHEAQNTITASSAITLNTTGANVKFDAGKAIDWLPGFNSTISSGTYISAYIDGCGGARMAEEQESEISTSALLYPNPASDQLYVRYTGEKPTQILLYDLQGREVFRGMGEEMEGEILLDIQTLPSGMYVCVIQRNGNSETQKIVKD